VCRGDEDHTNVTSVIFTGCSPSDFYLFGTVKQRVQTCQSGSYEQLQANVQEILVAIDPVELVATLQAWIARERK
jgi:hypothetical protein